MTVRKIDLMHKMFGRTAGRKCAECKNLIEGTYRDKVYRKCVIYGITSSEATDWAKKYDACGKFNGEYKGRPIVRMVKPEKKSYLVQDDMQERMEV